MGTEEKAQMEVGESLGNVETAEPILWRRRCGRKRRAPETRTPTTKEPLHPHIPSLLIFTL
jgi:hypothetical protein